MRFKKYIEPIFIIILFNFIGILFSFFFADRNISYVFPTHMITKIDILKSFIFILINNIFVFFIGFYIIRFFLYIKNKKRYSKLDKYLYFLLNSIILIRTSFSTGILLSEASIQTHSNIFKLYLLGIIPHGIIEMIPFIIAYHINSQVIKNEQWNNVSHITFKVYIKLCLFLLLAAIIESIITPILLYGNIY